MSLLKVIIHLYLFIFLLFAECDSLKCPNISTPECREDQFMIQVQREEPCCFYPSCSEYYGDNFLKMQSQKKSHNVSCEFHGVACYWNANGIAMCIQPNKDCK